MRDLVLIGGGEHARVIAEAVRAARTHRILGFVDPNPYAGAETLSLRHLGGDDALASLQAAELVIAFGTLGPADRRMQVAARLLAQGFSFATVVHPSAVISPTARLGAGAVVCAGAIVQTGALVGAHAVVNTGAIVEHDVRLGDHVQLAPRVVIGGGTQIGAGSFIGLGATVRDHLRLGARVTVGMGAAVIADVPDDATALGVPARLSATAVSAGALP